MFFLTYLRAELLRRTRHAIVMALGLAVGIGLVVTVSASSDGVKKAQAAVLHALYGIGTDITVTTASPPPPKLGTPEAGKFGFTPGMTGQHIDQLGLVPGLGVLNVSAVDSVARLHGVDAAAGALTLQDLQLDVPTIKEQNTPGWHPSPQNLGTTFTVEGVDIGHTGLGPFASGKVSSGRSFTSADSASSVAVVDAGYATANRLNIGSTVTVGGKPFEVVGIFQQPQGGGASSVYIPLARAQALAAFQGMNSLDGRVDKIYVKASSGAVITSVQNDIKKLLPSATVTSSENLANAVNGSLASATSLATNLGKWLAIASLATAFAIASLLTMAAVTRRVREFGTLKALGWRSRRIVTQLIGESLVTGALGAAFGIALGYGGAQLIRHIAPKLSATVASNPGSKPLENVTLNNGGIHRQLAPGSSHTIVVHLIPPVTLTVILLAVLLAIAGSLIASSFGGWRIVRLRPAEALRRVE